MTCPNCNKIVPEGSSFCGFCGKNLSENVPPLQTDPSASVKAEKTDKKKTKKIIKLISVLVIGVFLIFVVSAIVVGIFVIPRFTSTKNAYIFSENGRYVLIKDLKEKKTIEIDTVKNDGIATEELKFSPDGRYVYYYSKYDKTSFTGTLCRAEYGKFKSNGGDNSTFITTVGSNVRYYEFLDGNKLVYINGDGGLYYFDGNNASRIDKDVKVFYTNKKNQIAYLVANEESGRGDKLYSVSVKDINNRIKLSSNVSYILDGHDLSQILFGVIDDNGNTSLYTINSDGNSEMNRIAKDIDVVTYSYGESYEAYVYYTIKTGKTISLSRLVREDSYGDSDGYSYADLIREYLNDPQYDVEISSLYCYCTGNSTMISEDVIDYNRFQGGLIYHTVDMVDGKMEIDDILSFNQTHNLPKIGTDMDFCYVPENETRSIRVSSELISYLADTRYMFMVSDQNLLVVDTEDATYLGDTSGDSLDKMELLEENSAAFDYINGTLYYFANVHSYNNSNYGDLYAYNNGTRTLLAPDIYCECPSFYKNGDFLVYSECEKNKFYELNVYSANNTKTHVSDTVEYFVRTSEKGILYISDGDLYYFDGKTSNRIQYDVDRIWCLYEDQMTNEFSNGLTGRLQQESGSSSGDN